MYKRNGMTTIPIQACCDADYTADGNRKLTSGYDFLLAGTAISWQAKKQTTVAQLTVEGEYAVMAHTEKELMWLTIRSTRPQNVKVCADNRLLRQSWVQSHL